MKKYTPLNYGTNIAPYTRGWLYKICCIHALFSRHLWIVTLMFWKRAYLLLYNCASTKRLIEGDLTDFSIGAKETNVAVPTLTTRSKITLSFTNTL